MADNFLSSILQFIIKAVFWLLGQIVSLVIHPLQAIVVTAFPGIGWVLSEILTFCNDKLFPMVGFMKDVFLGITCCPPELWNVFIGILAFRLGILPAIQFILVAINAWKIKSGNINLK